MVLAGDPILASDLVTPTYIVKSGAESVTSSTTQQDDNDLFVDLTVGTWRVQAFLHWVGDNTGVSGTGDIDVAWTTTGTITSLGRSVIAGGRAMTSVTDATVCLQGLVLTTAAWYGGNASSTNLIVEDLLLDVSVAGRLQLTWAQHGSSGTATTLSAASRIIITQLVAN